MVETSHCSPENVDYHPAIRPLDRPREPEENLEEPAERRAGAPSASYGMRRRRILSGWTERMSTSGSGDTACEVTFPVGDQC